MSGRFVCPFWPSVVIISNCLIVSCVLVRDSFLRNVLLEIRYLNGLHGRLMRLAADVLEKMDLYFPESVSVKILRGIRFGMSSTMRF